MENILRLFRESTLYNACIQMIHHLHVAVNEVTKEPIPFEELYKGTYAATLPIALQEVLDKVSATYYIGNIDEATLAGKGVAKTLDEVNAATQGGKYEGMMVFAVDISDGKELTRQESTVLTRAFNRIASAQPVILFIRQGKYLSLSTCERMKFSQEWRNGSGEKLGKVSILRNIDCEHPHRGHLDILDDLGDHTCTTFDELYKHWMDVFSNELLTKKFYTELSNWYAWAVQVARFPNDLTTNEDDEKFNHEACIRLITRLIFVWFLKQKHLIPDAFFDEKYIREHFIENFDPHDRKNLYYDTEKSKYYRLILQNLFFAMLNRPIVAEGKGEANNRRFRSKVTGSKNWDYNINNLMRYGSDFMPGGAEQFLQLANSCVPFLNGGLFECLDDKPNKMYYDGFSELDKSLEQLFLPDYLFFGDEVGASIDLSKWYGDKKKKSVSAQGIIDILRHYCFTVEENTPYDQEVSLDPELLGKAFENLLAAYNPETQTSARKQTGSFYTPREIVQYMVNESLVAHLKRICGEQDETLYRQLLSYSSDDVLITDNQGEAIMKALYNCRVLDPACGSGAFPMGVLQQMVHVLKRIDPTNEKWKDFMIDRAIEQSKKAFNVDSEAERKERLADIESAFNQSVNDPDYARKLYLIEHCIYGVDIQPIATQISKLRFFISLVVDQRPTTDATHNFGIRPLPNLEAKFVSANTLIPIEYDSSLVDSAPEVIKYKEKLKELNHKIFLARRNTVKQDLKKQIKETRHALADAIEATGFVSHGAAEQLAGWDMFDQNLSSSFFDPEWMFGVKGGFDVVIGNPPYVEAKKLKGISALLKKYTVSSGTADLSVYFIEKGLGLCAKCGSLFFITTNKFFNTGYGKKVRHMLLKKNMSRVVNLEQVEVFENVLVSSVVIGIINTEVAKENNIAFKQYYKTDNKTFRNTFSSTVYDYTSYPQNVLDENEWSFSDTVQLLLKKKIEKNSRLLGNIDGVSIYRGVTTGYNPAFIISNEQRDKLVAEDIKSSRIIKNMLQGRNIRKWYYNESDENLIFTRRGTDIDDYPCIKSHLYAFYNNLKPKTPNNNMEGRKPGNYLWFEILDNTAYYLEFEKPEKIIWGLTADKWAFTMDTYKHYLPSNAYILTSSNLPIKYILGILNSDLMKYYFSFIGIMTAGGAYTLKASTISVLPIRIIDDTKFIENVVDEILNIKNMDKESDVTKKETELNDMVYKIYGLSQSDRSVIFANSLLFDIPMAADVVDAKFEDDIPIRQSPEFDMAADISLPNNDGVSLYDWIVSNECTDIEKVKKCLCDNGYKSARIIKKK